MTRDAFRKEVLWTDFQEQDWKWAIDWLADFIVHLSENLSLAFLNR